MRIVQLMTDRLHILTLQKTIGLVLAHSWGPDGNHMFSMNESNDEKKSSIRTGSIN
jgi:hypothetical protein